MPVFDRYRGESIIIGDTIKITVLGRKGDEVRIGIQAPKEVKIIRAELVEKYPPKKNNTISKENINRN